MQPGERDFQQAVEFSWEVDRHPRMHCSLLVEEPVFATDGKDSLVPDIRMYVETLIPAEQKTDEIFGTDVIAGHRQGSKERHANLWKEQLPAIRMVICVPQQ